MAATAKYGSLRASTHQRNLESGVSEEVCTQILDGYLGTSGVERAACQTCTKDPNDDAQYIITCDFTDYCSFCAHDDPAGPDSCYTLTHEYTVRPWNGRFVWIEDIAYSACGIYHDTGRKACLDETYYNWGYLNSRCVSVDDESCGRCEPSNNCSGDNYYFYDCGNIEPDFVMDDCDYSINDYIEKDSVFVGFNYALYAADTALCFDDDKGYLGNIDPEEETPPDPTPVADPAPTQPEQSELIKRSLQSFTVKVVVKDKFADDVDEEIVQSTLTQILFDALSSRYPTLESVELIPIHRGRNRILKKTRFRFRFTGEVYFSEESVPRPKKVKAEQKQILRGVSKIGKMRFRIRGLK